MLLTRHSSVIVEPERIVYGDLQGQPIVRREATASADYEDISSIVNWDAHGRETGDYKAVRAEIKALYAGKAWVDHTASEKDVCARWFVATPVERDDVFDRTQQVALGKVFHAESVGARQSRVVVVTSEVYNRLEKPEADIVIDDVNGLLSKYVEFGREGTLEGDSEGLFDYVEARTGTSYAATGFAAKAWTPVGYADMASFATAVMGVLRDGAY